MDDAEFFLPSEIARLVYGHLKTMGCDEVTAKFLDESPHLSECRELHKRNRSFNTEANGLSLKEILDQFLNMNKLILSAVNMMNDSEKFKNPVEALNFILNPSSVVSKEQSSVVVNSASQIARENQSRLSSSSDEEFFSDISLNLKTPDKSRSAKKYTKKKLESVHEEDYLSDKSEPENTPVVNKILKKPMILLPRQSTRLQMKRASNKERLSNSDGLKDFRKSPSDCETPRKIGKPPYSETKMQKPKISITLTSSDSENENVANTSKANSTISDDLNSTKDSCKSNPVNGLFSPETKKITPKKKTLKVLRPRRPPSSPLKRPSVANEKVKCKRDRSSEQNTSKEYVEENKNTESSQPSNLDSQIIHENDKSDKPPRTSEELIFTTELSQNSEKSTKVRRKSVHAIQKDDEKTTSKQNKANKSMIVINDETIREKLMENPKLHEHIAGNINKIVYSPQKKINLASKEEVDNAVKEIVNTTASDPLFDELLKDLFGNLSNDEDNAGDEQNSNLPSQPEHTEKDNVCTVSNDNEQNQTQMPEIAPDESSIVIEEDVASHTSEPNAIIIEISQEQLSNQNYSLEQSKNYQKPLSSTEDIRTYLSFSADVSSSPDRDHSNMKANDNFVTFTAENGEFVQSCEVATENERIYVNPNSVLYPVTEGVPLVVGKRTKFEMCGAPSQLAQITRKQKYVPIAPKPNHYEIIGEAEPTRNITGITKKKRTRGGRRP